MKIAIIGAGAMGSVYAGLLTEAGHEIWAIDTWSDHIDAINAKGLQIEGPSGDRVVQGIHATTDVADAGACDLYVIATKGAGVGPAASAIAPLMHNDSLVLTIQNGLGAGERIAQYLPTENVLLGVADGFGASMKGPGHAHHNAMNLIRIGEMRGGMTDRLQELTVVWAEAGFKAKAFDDIHQLVWEKFICNCTYSAPCTVFQCTLGELMANADNFNIALGCAREVFALGTAKGINFSFDDPVAYVTAFGKKMPGSKPSMLQDSEARRPSEIDAINGMAPVLGRELGIPTPYNETLAAVVRAREAQFQKD
ncbi:MAG: 2-dehydropantoate 2-reductase [Rhodospirillaceae bacterium]|jgi:2-dehydropantoate 2-reductase|nr:2-dehydropantoate 2-reductase [Rhodospirillaceae bacterium]